MNNLKQQRLILIVWVITIIIAIFMAFIQPTLINPYGGQFSMSNNPPVFSLVPIITALLWTGLSWLNHRKSKVNHSQTISHESTSIPYKMALLLEMMDEDEREAFKHQLKRDILASETGYGDFNRLALDETEKRKRG